MKKTGLIFLAGLLMLNMFGGAVLAQGRVPIVVEFFSLIYEYEDKGAVGRGDLYTDARVWYGDHGLDYVFPNSFSNYKLSRLKYMHKIANGNYWGIGAGEVNYDN
ncbi:hypothetical protein ACFL5U_00205 [Candidatus Margulisiibacteriota bacterium]